MFTQRWMRQACTAGGMLLLAAVASGGVRAAESSEPADLPSTVERLDAERAALQAAQQTASEQAAAIRREASELERRRQELLRALDAEAAALAAREQQNAEAAAEQESGLAARAAEIEAILRAGGRWVSFADQIAPLLRARCVACHSSREPGGGHVLTSYAGLFSAGANGPAVLPGDEASLLCEVVADGSMPQDGEPLSEEEVDLIRRWVALGARLDAGADATAALVRIMPRPVQPEPPATYPAAMPVSAVAFDPTAMRLASSGYHEVLLWDLRTVADGGAGQTALPQLLGRIPNLPERVQGLAFSADGQRLAVAAGTPGLIGEAAIVAVGSAGEGAAAAAQLTSLGRADDAFLSVAFSADAERLIAAAADQSVRLYDTASGVQQSERTDHADWVQAVALSADGTRLVTASRDATAKVIDLASGQLQTTFSKHGEPVTAVCWLDNELVATGGADGQVRFWKADSGEEVRSIKGFAESIEGLCLLADGRLAVADRSGTVRLHAVADGKRLRTIPTGGGAATSLAVSADSRLLAVGSLDGSISLIRLDADAAEPLRWLAAP